MGSLLDEGASTKLLDWFRDILKRFNEYYGERSQEEQLQLMFSDGQKVMGWIDSLRNHIYHDRKKYQDDPYLAIYVVMENAEHLDALLADYIQDMETSLRVVSFSSAMLQPTAQHLDLVMGHMRSGQQVIVDKVEQARMERRFLGKAKLMAKDVQDTKDKAKETKTTKGMEETRVGVQSGGTVDDPMEID